MITKNDIVIHQADTGRNIQLNAVAVGAFCELSKDAIYDIPNAIEHAKRELRIVLHHKIYGDLREKLQSIELDIKRSDEFFHNPHMQKVWGEIMEIVSAAKIRSGG